MKYENLKIIANGFKEAIENELFGYMEDNDTDTLSTQFKSGNRHYFNVTEEHANGKDYLCFNGTYDEEACEMEFNDSITDIPLDDALFALKMVEENYERGKLNAIVFQK